MSEALYKEMRCEQCGAKDEVRADVAKDGFEGWCHDCDAPRQYYFVWLSVPELRDEIARLKAEGDWQPIETAPKDGTDLLLWLADEHRPMVGFWGQPALLAPCAEQWTDGHYNLAGVSAWLPIPRREG